MNIGYYLAKSPEELRDINLKNEIINNSNKYIFVWFCQSASKEQIEMLLNDEGINILSQADALRDKLNGILTSGTEFNMCANETFCKMVIENNMISYIGSLNKEAALSFYKYVGEYDEDKIMDVYYYFYADNQIRILENHVFEPEEKLSILKRSRKEAAEFLLNRDVLDLSQLSVSDIERLFEKKIVIPEKNFTMQLIDKIASIHDVNRYRLLMNQLEEEIDVSKIETVRRKQYEKEMATINEEGLLGKFQILKDRIKSGEVSLADFETIKKVEGFNGAEELIFRILHAKNIDEAIKKENDYYLSNIIIDYYFKDVPTNFLKNVRAMMAYDKENPFLLKEDKDIYNLIQNIDNFDSAHKLMLFKVMKEQNIEWTEKFYDDFTQAKDTMVNQINESILTKDNISGLYNETLSKQAGVPIYCLNGQKYKALIRNIGVEKNHILSRENLGFITDGGSFSLDGSEMVNTFGRIDEQYVLAFSGVPEKQLVHSFFGDSFTNYRRDENDIPQNRDSAARVIGLYTPEQLTTIGIEYNELLVSVPNSRKESNEFEKKLEKPEAFAIYCYDEIKPADIESAKRLGLSIIVVDTKAYNVDRSGRASTHDDTPWDGKRLQYISESGDKDERYHWER